MMRNADEFNKPPLVIITSANNVHTDFCRLYPPPPSSRSSPLPFIIQTTSPIQYARTQHLLAILCLDCTPLHLLPAVPLALLLKVLALLLGAQASKLRIALLALELVGCDLALLGLLLLVDFADLGNLLVARLLDAAQGLGAEVRGRGEVVWEAQEILEEWQGGGVVGGELHGEVDALLGLGVVEAGVCQLGVRMENWWGLTSWVGRWAGR
jgi:hypothetical protein